MILGLHIWRMAAYARAIAEAIGWPEHLERLELVCPLHDSGKIGIPDGILKALRKLTERVGDHGSLPHYMKFY